MVIKYVVLCVLIMSVSFIDAQSCKTPNNKNGKCIEIYHCNALTAMVTKKDRTTEENEFLKKSRCGPLTDIIPKVCCPLSDVCITPDEQPGKCIQLFQCAHMMENLRGPNRDYYVSYVQKSLCKGPVDESICCDLSSSTSTTTSTTSSTTMETVTVESRLKAIVSNSDSATVNPSGPTTVSTLEVNTKNKTFEACKTPNNKNGKCVGLFECKTLMDMYTKNDQTDTDIQFLRNSKCGIQTDTFPKVCCPLSDTCVTPDGQPGKCINLFQCTHLMENLRGPNYYYYLNYTKNSLCQGPEDQSICCSPPSSTTVSPPSTSSTIPQMITVSNIVPGSLPKVEVNTENKTFELCKTPNNKNGRCVELYQCKDLTDLDTKKDRTDKDIEFLKNSKCGMLEETIPKVCCLLPDTCITPDGQPGRCINLFQCTHLMENLRGPNRDYYLTYTKNSLCQGPEDQSICCGPSTSINIIVSTTSSTTPQIITVDNGINAPVSISGIVTVNPSGPSSVSTVDVNTENKTFESCKTPNNKNGKCVDLYQCQAFADIITTKDRTEADNEFLRNSKCGMQTNMIPKVCCPLSDTCVTPDGQPGKCINLFQCTHMMENLRGPNRELYLNYVKSFLCHGPEDQSICCASSSKNISTSITSSMTSQAVTENNGISNPVPSSSTATVSPSEGRNNEISNPVSSSSTATVSPSEGRNNEISNPVSSSSAVTVSPSEGRNDGISNPVSSSSTVTVSPSEGRNNGISNPVSTSNTVTVSSSKASSVSTVDANTENKTFESCKTPNNKNGKCVDIYLCRALTGLVTKKDQSNTDIEFLRNSKCGMQTDIFPKVCCLLSDTCVTPDGQPGKCINLFQCTHMMENLRGPNRDLYLNYVKISSCEGPDDQSICCGPSSPINFAASITSFTTPQTGTGDNGVTAADPCSNSMTANPPERSTMCCGIDVNSKNKNFGDVTWTKKYPWLVVVEYLDQGKVKLLCGGSLISGKYVLTAGHCVKRKVLDYAMPKNVRLGEFNTTSNGPDCVPVANGVDCTDPVHIIPIEKVIPHPDYEPYSYQHYHDIALIRLTSTAPFTEFVRPICLPSMDYATNPPKSFELIVAGWGHYKEDGFVHEKASDVKRELKIPYANRSTCQEARRTLYQSTYIEVDNGQICAGGEAGTDTCKGDAGGPLMYNNGETFELVGVAGYGASQCGLKNILSIYTNVHPYVEWIMSNIEP